VPRRRDARQVAALGAAVVLAVELAMTHWFYLYVVWFLPLVLVALLAAHDQDGPAEAAERIAEAEAVPAGAPLTPA
jgi:hypothetical protein